MCSNEYMNSGDEVALAWNIKQHSSDVAPDQIDAAPDQIDADHELLEKETKSKMSGSSIRNLK